MGPPRPLRVRYHARVRWTLLATLGLMAAGCCGEVGACPQNDVKLVVSADGASVGVTVEGYDDFECTQGDGATVCQPGAIADGDYELIVHADGYAPQAITLRVRTNQAPPYSCQCEIPTGSETLELAPPEGDPDAGSVEDGGVADGG